MVSISLDQLFVREFERGDGTVLQISQCEVGDVGAVVWDAAIVLAAYLQMQDLQDEADDSTSPLQGRRLVELGAGTGLVGLQAACLGADTVITDLEDVLPLMKLNVQRNQSHFKGSVAAHALKWGEDVTTFLPPPDYVCLADCIYYEQSIEPLVKTICELSGPDTTVLCCYEERTTGNKPELQRRFFELIEVDFHVDEVPLDRQDPQWRSPDIHIIRFRHR